MWKIDNYSWKSKTTGRAIEKRSHEKRCIRETTNEAKRGRATTFAIAKLEAIEKSHILLSLIHNLNYKLSHPISHFKDVRVEKNILLILDINGKIHHFTFGRLDVIMRAAYNIQQGFRSVKFKNKYLYKSIFNIFDCKIDFEFTTRRHKFKSLYCIIKLVLNASFDIKLN